MIEKLRRVPLREVWKHEAADFTTWLRDNIDVLNDVLGVSLANAEREQAAGTFNIDLVAEDDAGNPVVIENQLEKSDHDHLGKVITYLTAIDAKVAVWIVADPRPEHIKAVGWLNESTAASFYLVKVEAVRIGDSPPAPLLTLIVGPSEESRKMGEINKELAERQVLRYRFWEKLLESCKQKLKLFGDRTPSRENWLAAGAGKGGLKYAFVLQKHAARIELYIDRGQEHENKAVLEQLEQQKDAIERDFGEPLEWQRLEGRRAYRIQKQFSMGGWQDEDKWPEIQVQMIDAMSRLEKALKPHIQQLRI